MSTTSVMGGVVKRREDPALIHGNGIYVDDVKAYGMLHMAFNRSPYANARIKSIDTSMAGDARGRCRLHDRRRACPWASAGPGPVGKLRPLLADGVVKHVGEAVALVVAESPAQAADAADAIRVDYDPMKAIVDLKESASTRPRFTTTSTPT